MLPAVVLAHQQGMGTTAYKRQQKPLVHPINAKYELRGERRSMRTGSRIVWSAWCISEKYAFRIYDVCASTYKNAVIDDLNAWLRGL